MATDKPRFTIILEHDIASGVKDYWYSNRLKNKNAAINELLRCAFDSIEAEDNTKKELDLSSAALDLARKFDRLDAHSQKVITTLVDLELKRPQDYNSEVDRFNAMGGQPAIESTAL